MDRFVIRYDISDIDHWAGRYEYPGEQELLAVDVPRIRAAGYLTKDDLLILGRWKSPRIVPKLKRNPEDQIEEITRVAMTAQSERLRVGALIQLEGVGWPVASTILHLCHRDPYPLLDYRALWSLGVDAPAFYTFNFWWAYTQHCRELAQAVGVSMRTLDRALWQYSKENQPSGKSEKDRDCNSMERDLLR